MNRRLFWAIGALLIVGAVLALAIVGQKSADSKIRIGYLPYSSALPFFVAQEKDFFKEQGLSIEGVKVGSSNEAIDALRSGELDFVVGLGLSTFFAVDAAGSASFKTFQPSIEDKAHIISYLLVRKESELNDLAELRGKKVGTYSGASQVLVLKLLLEKLGLDPNDPASVQIGDIASNLQVDALATGQFDAFLMIEPYATVAMTLRGARPLVTSPRIKYLLNPFAAGANGVSTTFLTKHGDLARKVVAVLDSAIEAIHSDEAAAKGILPRYIPTVTPDIAEKAGIYKWWAQSQTEIAPIQKYADLLYEGGVLKKQVDVTSMFLRPNF